MKTRRQKNYWIKLKRRFNTKTEARGWATQLRVLPSHQVSHVTTEKTGDGEYTVSYSLSWTYQEALESAGMTL